MSHRSGRQVFTLSQAGKQLGIMSSSKERRKGESVLEAVAVSKSLLHILHSLEVSFIPVWYYCIHSNNITHTLGKIEGSSNQTGVPFSEVLCKQKTKRNLLS